MLQQPGGAALYGGGQGTKGRKHPASQNTIRDARGAYIGRMAHLLQHTREKAGTPRGMPRPAPVRRRRAMGRIEHALLVGELSARPNRPKTFARAPTVPQKVTNVSIYSEGQKPRGASALP